MIKQLGIFYTLNYKDQINKIATNMLLKQFRNISIIPENLNIEYINYKNIYYDNNWKYLKNGKNITEFDYYFLIGRNRIYSLKTGLMYWANLNKKLIFNYSGFKYVGNKLVQMIFCNHYHHPQPKSIFFHLEEKYLSKYYNIFNRIFQFPVIIKYPISSKGKGVFLINNNTELESIIKKNINKNIIIQEYIPNIGDYRVIIMGNKHILTYKKYNSNSFKHNIAQGAEFHIVQLPDQIIKQCIQIINNYGLDFAGIDLIITGDHNFKILEINSWPGYRLLKKIGFNLGGEIIKYFSK